MIDDISWVLKSLVGISCKINPLDVKSPHCDNHCCDYTPRQIGLKNQSIHEEVKKIKQVEKE